MFTKAIISALQTVLVALGLYQFSDVDGERGPLTDAAVAKFVALWNVFVATGATYATGALSVVSSVAGSFGDTLASIAETQIGTQEDAAHSNRGSAILKYQEATSLGGQGWPWCAAFVDWCAGQVSDALRPKAFLVPDTAAAFGLIEWAENLGLKVFKPGDGINPKRGDIVVYTFSHTGIVSGFNSGTTFAAVEGNTNENGGSDGYEVARRTRNFGEVRAWIRIA